MTRPTILPAPPGVPYFRRMRAPVLAGSPPRPAPNTYAAIAAVSPTIKPTAVVSRGLATNVLAAVPPGYQLGPIGTMSNLSVVRSNAVHGDIAIAGRELPVDVAMPELLAMPPVQPSTIAPSERLEGRVEIGNSTTSVPRP